MLRPPSVPLAAPAPPAAYSTPVDTPAPLSNLASLTTPPVFGADLSCANGLDAAARDALAKPTIGDFGDGKDGGSELLKYLEGGGLQCPLCGAALASLAQARRHLEAHYPRDSPVCPVAECARYFAHPNSVRNHMRIKHRRQWEKMKTLKWSCGWAN
ncbi:unnamed protein product [Danaus chrysippus]|uniref:(African queen) hypothetical protein n=1 Tax=Danaus chrysippus TaxID=151541 RepID=A0A8J2W3P3_9NEOP|nr:unnamed protein product [Danaus chrysippus]